MIYSVASPSSESKPQENDVIETPKVNKSFLSLPFEIQLRILKILVLSQTHCIKGTLYDECYDPWDCPFTHPESLPESLHDMEKRALPDFRIARVCRMFWIETFKLFFKHNVFILNALGGDEDLRKKVCEENPNNMEIWKGLRDPIATRLLDFTDAPSWKDKGYPFFHSHVPFQSVSPYRHLIRNLVIHLQNPWFLKYEPDWNWPLKVKWETLPYLEFLQLDLRTFSRYPIMEEPVYEYEEYNELLISGAKGMVCLNLKKLVLVGLCSYYNFKSTHRKVKMEKLFRPAMRDGGIIEFVDKDDWEYWPW